MSKSDDDNAGTVGVIVLVLIILAGVSFDLHAYGTCVGLSIVAAVLLFVLVVYWHASAKAETPQANP